MKPVFKVGDRVVTTRQHHTLVTAVIWAGGSEYVTYLKSGPNRTVYVTALRPYVEEFHGPWVARTGTARFQQRDRSRPSRAPLRHGGRDQAEAQAGHHISCRMNGS